MIFPDILKKNYIVISEALASFKKNNNMTAASSLAFSATLALIPTLFFLTFLLGAVIDHSDLALATTEEILVHLAPAYSGDILREVQYVSSHIGTIGAINLIILLWTVTPFMTFMRTSLKIIFKKKGSRPFLLEKFFDAVISIIFIALLSAVSIAGIIVNFSKKIGSVYSTGNYINTIIPFILVVCSVFLLYYAFSGKVRKRHLLAGSAATAILWFMLTPAFYTILSYNPGYGLAFGSFKSLFVCVIWIYYSLVVFLAGAEIAAALSRDETVFIKKLIEGKQQMPSVITGKYVTAFSKGDYIFREGEPAELMYGVISGRVSVRKSGKEIAVITRGKCFGGISFLLSSPRVASSIALEDVELAEISRENIYRLMNEYPEFVLEILREMAVRLQESNTTAD